MATRRERVVLDLQDNFTGGMARAAAATAVLNRELNSLSGSSVSLSRTSRVIENDITRVSVVATKADGSINQLTGRLRVLGEVAAVLGPSLAPLGGVAIAGVAGLANQMGVAAVAGGVLIGSLQGVGDALGAMNKAQLDPTNKNLEAAEEALKRLSPAAREFAEAAFDLKPALVAIRDMGAEALMPGLTESLDNLERLGPKVAGIFQTLSGAMGDIAADSTASLASDRWADFFAFIEREVPDAITELASTVGSLTHGMTELWEAFTPLNDDFSSWMMNAAAGFDEWATGLSATEGFQEFIDYVRTTGPQVADTLGAIANAAVQIVQATAPLGGPVLAGIEAAAKAIGAIADSDLGTPIMGGVAALALLNRSLAVTASLSKASLSGGLFAGLGTAAEGAKKGSGSVKALGGDLAVLGRNFTTAGAASERMAAQNAKALSSIKETGRAIGGPAALLGGLAVASTGVADGFGLTNTASLALMGTIAGPWGAAVGAGAGLLLDLKAANDQTAASFEAFEASLQSMSLDELNAKLRETNALFSDANKVGETGGPKGETAAAKAIKEQIEVQKQAERESRDAALAFLEQTGANVNLAKWSRKSAEDIKAQANAILDAQESANKTAASFITLGESLNDGKVSLGDWIKEMRDSAIALEQFTANSRKAAKRGLDDGLIESLQQAGEEGALRMKQLANGTDAAIDQANAAFGRGERAAKSYNDFKVPPKKLDVDPSAMQRKVEDAKSRLDKLNGMKPTPKVDAETAAAESKLNNLLALLREAERDRASTVTTTFVTNRVVNTRTNAPGPQDPNTGAFGATVPKTGLPYADRHLYLVADGEEIVTNAPSRNRPADTYRPVLKAINNNLPRAVIKAMLAEGGTAGDDKKKRRRKFNGAQTDWAPNNEPSEQAQAQAAEATEQYYAEQERAQREAEERAEHQAALEQERAEHQAAVEEEMAEHNSKMFLAAIEGQERAAQGLIDAAQTQKQSAEQVRDGWAQAMERAGSAATAGFSSNLFGEKQTGMWSGGKGSGGSWMDALTGDISGLQERQGLIAQLSAQGVTGSALEALLGQGNNEQIAELINSGQAGQFAATFAQREALLGSTSQMAGQAAYGAEHAAASAAVAAVDARIGFLEAQLAAISAQRPITVYEAHSAAATAAEVARLTSIYGAG